MSDREELRQAMATRLRLEQWSGVGWLPTTTQVSHRTLDGWAQEAQGCRACRLCEGRRTVVFGEGNPKARVMFIGEAPGMEEDLQGRPFVGAAGELLTRILRALGVTRDDVYIANLVKCRPPQNRVPLPDELAACRRYLDAQIALIRPRVICALGRTAANALLRTEHPVGALRGTAHRLGEIPVVVTYHPAHLLRHPESKRDAWADVQQLLPYLKSQRREAGMASARCEPEQRAGCRA